MGIEQYIEALKIIEELEQKYNHKETYYPFLDYEPSPTQYEFHTSLAKERVLLGANKSGKSYAGAIETCWHITGIYPEWYPEEGKIFPEMTNDRELKIIINVETLDKVKDNILPLLKKFLKGILKFDYRYSGPQQYITEINFSNGVRIKFSSNRMKTEALEGGEADFFWSDEPPNREHYIALLRAFLKKHSRLIITATALKFGWLTEHFLEPPLELKMEREKIGKWAIPWVKAMSLDENKHLTEEEKSYWRANLMALDYEEAQARLEGIPFAKIGRVFGNDFDETKHITPSRILEGKNYCLYFSLDPHDRKGPAMLWVAVRKPDKYGVSQKIAVYSHYDKLKYMTPKDIVNFIKEVEQDHLKNYFDVVPPVITRYIDTKYAEHQQITGQKYRDYLIQSSVELGYPMAFKKSEGGLTLGHNAIRDVLRGWTYYNEKEPEFIIFDNCKELIEAFKFYSYKYGEEGVEEEYKDMIDCLRYMLTDGIYYYDIAHEDYYVNKISNFFEIT